jgi:hypothetical protein
MSVVFLYDLNFPEEKHGDSILPRDYTKWFVRRAEKKNWSHIFIDDLSTISILETPLFFIIRQEREKRQGEEMLEVPKYPFEVERIERMIEGWEEFPLFLEVYMLGFRHG